VTLVRRRRATCAVVMILALLLAPTFASAESADSSPARISGARVQPHVVPSDAAARIYLAQVLASLGRAEQLAQQASQYGDVGTFDVDRFLGELRTISSALQRFLLPDVPESGAHVSVEITGQYLYDGLSRRRQPGTPARVPHKELSRP
jgi:hypothetical protein